MDPATVVGTAIGVATGLAVPGTIAVLKLLPAVTSKNGSNGDGRIYEIVRKVVDDHLAPILNRQTTILERMQQTFVDNTTALQVFMKLEEQRERRHGHD